MLLGLSRVLLSGPTGTLFGEVDLALLIFVVYAGFEGTSAPDRNFAATVAFVTVWLGFPVVTTVAAPVTAAAFAAPRCADWGARPTDGHRLEMTAVRSDTSWAPNRFAWATTRDSLGLRFTPYRQSMKRVLDKSILPWCLGLRTGSFRKTWTWDPFAGLKEAKVLSAAEKKWRDGDPLIDSLDAAVEAP